jgi:hypothetical protein
MLRYTNCVAPEPFGTQPGRVAARLARVVERSLATVDLTLPQYRLLAFLGDDAVTAGSLAGGLSVSKPAITTLVDGLVEHVLTGEGVAALGRADEVVEQALVSLHERLPADKRRRAVEGLELWGHALDDLRSERKAGG